MLDSLPFPHRRLPLIEPEILSLFERDRSLFFWKCRCCGPFTTRKLDDSGSPPDRLWSIDLGRGSAVSNGLGIAIASNGNVIVEGGWWQSTTPKNLGCLDGTDGDQVWAIDVTNLLTDECQRAVTADASGGLYVIASGDLKKYNVSDGSLAWTADLVEAGTHVVCDGTNIYAGTFTSGGAVRVRKFDTSGTEITTGWPFTLATSSLAFLTDLSVAGTGDVYVSFGTRLVRLSSAGSSLFDVSFSTPPTTTIHRAVGDESGGCFIYGIRSSTDRIWHLDSAGAEITTESWPQTEDCGGLGSQYMLARKSTGNVVSVSTTSSPSPRGTVKEWSATGTLQWTYEHGHFLFGLAIDSSDQIHINGSRSQNS